MQSQACLSYAEVQPRLAVSFRALAIEIESGFQSLLRRQSLNSRQNYEQKKVHPNSLDAHETNYETNETFYKTIQSDIVPTRLL